MFSLILVLSLVIIIWATICHFLFPNKITLKEASIKSGALCIITVFMVCTIYFRNFSDTLILNGYVTNKEQIKVSCEHSYKCNCYTSCTGSGSSESCTTYCSTCYDHSYDYDWRVFTTVGKLNINRVNRQGTKEPPRWTQVIIGEPAATTANYINYIKAAPDSLFNMSELKDVTEKFGSLIPKYPEIYDYYRINRVINIGGVKYPHTSELNDLLNNELKTLGTQKQINIIVVFVKTEDKNYRYALERAWLGGKKNDLVIIFGMKDNTTVSWVDAFTFGKTANNQMLVVKIKDSMYSIIKEQQFQNTEVVVNDVIKTIKSDFHRKEMKDFEYLKSSYSPSTKALTTIGVILFVLLMSGTIFFYFFDLEKGGWDSQIGKKKFRVPYFTIRSRT